MVPCCSLGRMGPDLETSLSLKRSSTDSLAFTIRRSRAVTVSSSVAAAEEWSSAASLQVHGRNQDTRYVFVTVQARKKGLQILLGRILK